MLVNLLLESLGYKPFSKNRSYAGRLYNLPSGLFQFDIIFFRVLRGAHVELLGEGPAEIGLRVETNRLGDLVNSHIALKDQLGGFL